MSWDYWKPALHFGGFRGHNFLRRTSVFLFAVSEIRDPFWNLYIRFCFFWNSISIFIFRTGTFENRSRILNFRFWNSDVILFPISFFLYRYGNCISDFFFRNLISNLNFRNCDFWNPFSNFKFTNLEIVVSNWILNFWFGNVAFGVSEFRSPFCFFWIPAFRFEDFAFSIWDLRTLARGFKFPNWEFYFRFWFFGVGVEPHMENSAGLDSPAWTETGRI